MIGIARSLQYEMLVLGVDAPHSPQMWPRHWYPGELLQRV